MVEERAGQLEATIEAAEECGGCEQVVSSLQTELKFQQKKGSEASIWKQIEGTKSFLNRADKRYESLSNQIRELQQKAAATRSEIMEAKERLRILERDAAEKLEVPQTRGSNACMEEAMRSLLVILHSCELPPQAVAQIESIRRALPQLSFR